MALWDGAEFFEAVRSRYVSIQRRFPPIRKQPEFSKPLSGKFFFDANADKLKTGLGPVFSFPLASVPVPTILKAVYALTRR